MTGRAGLVLAGGRSRRFGQNDKALATLDGDPLLGRVVDRVSTVVDEVVVSCRPAQVDPFTDVLSSTAADGVVEDRIADGGPLAGLEAGLDSVSEPYTAVVACDMPLVEPAVLADLFERAVDADAAVPKHANGQLQPVQAVYRTRAMRERSAGWGPVTGASTAFSSHSRS